MMVPAKNPHFNAHEEVIFPEEAKRGLGALIAVCSIVREPGVGVCRWQAYPDAALVPALRLSRG